MAIIFDTNERPKLNVVIVRSFSDVILDSSGNDRQKCMPVLIPKTRANQGSMFYLGSIQSVDYVEWFLEDYHPAKNKIIFMKNRKNESTDQSPTINEKIETYILQYVR